MEEQSTQGYDAYYDFNTRFVDIDEKQRILKEKLLLISKNLIELRKLINDNFSDFKSELIFIYLK